jgi:regulator of sigma E protease
MTTLIIFILVLSLLVFVHEAGHFLAARFFGIKVYEFAIGFPPRAFGWYKDPKTGKRVWLLGKGKKQGEGLKDVVVGDDPTEEYPSCVYSFNWIPLGGFVRIKGETGQFRDEPDSFGHQAAWKRIVVLSAGVIMNFVLAALLLGFGFMIGLPSDASIVETDKHAQLLGTPQVLVQQVDVDSPAAVAELKLGDVVVSVDAVPVTTALGLTEYLTANQESEILFEIDRAGEIFETPITPDYLDGMDDKKRVGFVLADAALVKYPVHIALWKGLVAAVNGTILIFIGFFLLIKNLLLGNGLLFDIAGPVGIASIVGDSARLGISYLINITAMISLSLAVMNILPIPALDGGRILFVLLEKIIGKPVPMKYEQMAHTAGFMLLMLLIVVVTWRDIMRIF